MRSWPAAPEKNDGQRNHGHGQYAEIVLHAATLHARQQAAAFRKFLAGFVESPVDPVDVEQAVELRPEGEDPSNESNDSAPDAAIEPISHARPPCIEDNHRDAVELVDVEAIAERGPQPGNGFFERVELFRLGRFVA